MGEFSREKHYSRVVLQKSDPCGLGAWINLHPQFSDRRIMDRHLQDDREGKAAVDSGLPTREQLSCTCGMNRM
jgi:hypothetical protein